MKKKHMLKRLVSIFAIMIMVFSASITAFAGTTSSMGSGASSNGGGSSMYYMIGSSYSSGFRWVYFNGNKTIESPCKNGYAKVTMNGTHGAYIQKHDNQHGWYFFTWAWYFTWASDWTPRTMYNNGYGDPWDGYSYKGYNLGVRGKLTNQELLNEATNNKFYWRDWAWMYTQDGTGKGLETVWVSAWQSSTSSSKKSIVKIQVGNQTVLDRTRESAKNLYNNPTNSSTYSGKSLPTEMNHSKDIKVWVQTINKRTTFMTDGSNKWDYNDTFSKGGTTTMTRNIKYTVKAPSISEVTFRPFDLNKNGVADENEVKQTYSDYQNGSPELKMSVDNYQNITDGTELDTLDTNTSTKFNVTFNNDQFGIPKKSEGGFDLLNEAPGKDDKLNDGTYNTNVINKYGSNSDLTTGVLQSSGMGNTNVNGKQTDYIYWGGSLNGSVSSDSASITYNNEEKKGGNIFTFGKEFGGGDFTFKTIKIGDYKLVNGEIPWWEAQYEQGRFYTYGVEYQGTITLNSISTPSVKNSGMYARLSSKVNKQPILKGLFKAKTVGGNIG